MQYLNLMWGSAPSPKTPSQGRAWGRGRSPKTPSQGSAPSPKTPLVLVDLCSLL